MAKIVPRFCYAFSLLEGEMDSRSYDPIRKTLARALCSCFGWEVPKKLKVEPGIWFVVCGFPSVFALLRKLKLEMAARLKMGNNRAGRIFRSLYECDRGIF